MDDDRDFLLDGIDNGFQILPVDATLLPALMENYRSATALEARDQV